MEFNVKKCKVMELGKSKRRLTSSYTMGEVEIKKTKEEKDLEISITNIFFITRKHKQYCWENLQDG